MLVLIALDAVKGSPNSIIHCCNEVALAGSEDGVPRGKTLCMELWNPSGKMNARSFDRSELNMAKGFVHVCAYGVCGTDTNFNSPRKKPLGFTKTVERRSR